MGEDTWISVNDELPSDINLFLVYTNNGHMALASYYREYWMTDGRTWNNKKSGIITHWQHLPLPPKTP